MGQTSKYFNDTVLNDSNRSEFENEWEKLLNTLHLKELSKSLNNTLAKQAYLSMRSIRQMNDNMGTCPFKYLQ